MRVINDPVVIVWLEAESCVTEGSNTVAGCESHLASLLLQMCVWGTGKVADRVKILISECVYSGM